MLRVRPVVNGQRTDFPGIDSHCVLQAALQTASDRMCWNMGPVAAVIRDWSEMPAACSESTAVAFCGQTDSLRTVPTVCGQLWTRVDACGRREQQTAADCLCGAGSAALSGSARRLPRRCQRRRRISDVGGRVGCRLNELALRGESV